MYNPDLSPLSVHGGDCVHGEVCVHCGVCNYDNHNTSLSGAWRQQGTQHQHGRLISSGVYTVVIQHDYNNKQLCTRRVSWMLSLLAFSRSSRHLWKLSPFARSDKWSVSVTALLMPFHYLGDYLPFPSAQELITTGIIEFLWRHAWCRTGNCLHSTIISEWILEAVSPFMCWYPRHLLIAPWHSSPRGVSRPFHPPPDHRHRG